MTERRDRWDNPVSAESETAIEALDDTLMAYLAMRTDIGDRLKRAFETDPEMTMAHILKGAFLKMFATPAMNEAASKSAARARTILTQRGGTAREEAHLAALEAWCAGDMPLACRRWEAILIDHPRDPMAIKLSQLNRFYLGIGADMRDALARVWYAWDEAVPGYSFIAGSYAFALEEAGDYARAEPLGRRAVELEPEDVWGAHAVAHVLEMTGRPEEGLAWLDGLRPHWGNVHNFRHHAHWHRALFALDLGDADRALSIYDDSVWTEAVEDYLDLSNAASLLWRLAERGVDTGERIEAVANLAQTKARDHGLMFSDCHIALALAQAGRWAVFSDFLDDLNTFAEGDGTQASVAREVGRTLCMGAAADADDDPALAADLLAEARPSLYRIGGSKAQRDLFERMLIVNAVRSDRTDLARALLSERRENRPKDRWGEAIPL